LNSGLPTFKAGALPLESHLSPFCSGYVGDGVSGTIFPGWPQTAILPVSSN
jgi:hypothetical protein